MTKIKLINRKLFYDSIKTTSLSKLKPLRQSQINGIEVIFNEWDSRSDLTDLRWLAYMLATDYHECDGKFQPIEEYGKGNTRTYGKKRKHSGALYVNPNKIYYRRGRVQVT